MVQKEQANILKIQVKGTTNICNRSIKNFTFNFSSGTCPKNASHEDKHEQKINWADVDMTTRKSPHIRHILLTPALVNIRYTPFLGE